MIKTGNHGEYTWFESSNSYLSVLVDQMPDLVVEKYVAITAYDGDPLRLRGDEIREGWQQISNVALSPVIEQPFDVPQNQYDEWYVFPKLIPFSFNESFINYGGFNLDESVNDNPFLPSSYKKQQNSGNAILKQRQDRFWKQLEESGAETYLSENNKLLIVTREQQLTDVLHEYFSQSSFNLPHTTKLGRMMRQTFSNLAKKVDLYLSRSSE